MAPDDSPDIDQLRTARVGLPSSVVSRSFSSEVVVLNLDTGMYHGLNATAGRMLDVLVETGRFDTTVDQLTAEYDVSRETIDADLAELCQSLHERGLLEFDPES